jgi:hypothetical protein
LLFVVRILRSASRACTDRWAGGLGLSAGAIARLSDLPASPQSTEVCPAKRIGPKGQKI